MLKDVAKADGWGFAAWAGTLLAGCMALISGEWITALLFISLAALFAGALREALEARQDLEPAKWPRGALIVGAVGFLGVAVAHVADGDVPYAVLAGLAGAVVLAGLVVGRLRAGAGRLTQGRR